MIFGIGINIIEAERFENQISKNNGFRKKVFTQREIEYCESKKNKAQHYAAHFAAKEAFFKVIGTGWKNGMAFNEIVVLNNELVKPEIILYGNTKRFIKKNNITKIHLSLSHIKDLAVAL